MNPQTRPPVLSTADIERIVHALSKRGGANVSIQDPRVSQVQMWIFGLVGAGIVGAALWVANSISDLKVVAERQTVLIEQLERRITRLEERRP